MPVVAVVAGRQPNYFDVSTILFICLSSFFFTCSPVSVVVVVAVGKFMNTKKLKFH